MTLLDENIDTSVGLIQWTSHEEREKAFAAATRHSRIVRFFRLALPIGAFLSIAGIFFLSGFLSETKLQFSIDNISIGTDGLTMNNARLTGVDQDNQYYEIIADTAIQSLTNPSIMVLNGINAHLSRNLEEQGWAKLEAAEGVYDRENEQLRLEKDIRVQSSEGYDIRMNSADVDLGEGTVLTQDPVTINMLNGTLRAQGMEITDNGKTLRFTNGVSLNFVPSNDSEPDLEVPNE